ncbi:MAG: hypothetical protein IKM25_05950 [Clostridia bacterium]|nr:hypothetical protein [Clostridia bacterium]
MKKLSGNRISNVLIAGIASAAVAIVALLVTIFLNTSNLTAKEITNGLSATFDACESVANIAELMGDMFGDDGEEAVEIAEINEFDYNVAISE